MLHLSYGRLKILVVGVLGASLLFRDSVSPENGGVERSLSSTTSQEARLKASPFTQPELQKLSELRYVTFGASRTWGAGMGADRFKAYPYILSDEVVNLAIRACGPEYPALCTYTMLGEDTIADVVILEYYLDAKNNLLRLAKRLRQRYPHATMIFLRIWGPFQYQHAPTNEFAALKKWLPEHSIESIWDENFTSTMMMEKPEDWLFTSDQAVIDAQNEAIEASGGYLFELERPEDPRVALTEYAHLYSKDMVHLSVQGHAFVANSIRRMLLDLNVTRHDDVQPWVASDQCDSWYEEGSTPTFALVHPMIIMNKFSTDHSLKGTQRLEGANGKFALEITGTTQWIRLHNALDQPADVFLRFMVEGPPPSRYPQTRILLGPDDKEGVVLDPTVADYLHMVHVNRVAKVGTIPPGHTVMRMIPLEPDKQDPFRITGIIITPLDETPPISTPELALSVSEHVEVSTPVLEASAPDSLPVLTPEIVIPVKTPELPSTTPALLTSEPAVTDTPEEVVLIPDVVAATPPEAVVATPAKLPVSPELPASMAESAITNKLPAADPELPVSTHSNSLDARIASLGPPLVANVTA
jgi:hypothetical protein